MTFNAQMYSWNSEKRHLHFSLDHTLCTATSTPKYNHQHAFVSHSAGAFSLQQHTFSSIKCVMQTSSAVATPSTRPMRTTVGSLASWLMAYTMMQPGASGGRNGTTSKFDNDQEISAVSVLDDDGASGVGAAAAAAVSVALARSWASAASQKQAAMVERTTSGSLKPGRAGFRLVAAVSNTDLVRLGGSNKRSTYDPEVLIRPSVAARRLSPTCADVLGSSLSLSAVYL